MSKKAIVLGASQTEINIGTAVEIELREHGWNVRGDDCCQGPGLYQAPIYPLVNFDAMVVTLGATHMEPIDEVSEDDITKVIYGSLELPLLCVRNYVRARGDEGGKIVLIGSYAHNHPFSNGYAYCSAKAGLDMAGKCLGWDLTDRGYRVHVVHPYHVVGTPMWEQVERGVMETKGLSREEARAYSRGSLKMPDLSTPWDVAKMVKLLLNERVAGWTSGTAIEMYGGTR